MLDEPTGQSPCLEFIAIFSMTSRSEMPDTVSTLDHAAGDYCNSRSGHGAALAASVQFSVRYRLPCLSFISDKSPASDTLVDFLSVSSFPRVPFPLRHKLVPFFSLVAFRGSGKADPVSLVSPHDEYLTKHLRLNSPLPPSPAAAGASS